MFIASRIYAIALVLLCVQSPAVALEPTGAAFTIGARGRIYIQAEVSGHVVNTLIDTGLSSTFVLTPDTAAQIRPRYVPFIRTAPMRGIDGQGTRGRIAAIKVTDLGGAAGDWDIASVVVDIPILNADAMMGMAFLSSYDVTFDFDMQRLSLAQPGRVAVSPGSFQNCSSKKPAFSLDDLCGTSAVYIDTGGQSTVINTAMAARLGIPSDARSEPATLTGASGRPISALRYDHPVEINGYRVASVLIADFPNRGGCVAPCAEAILGMDTLGRLSALRITPTHIALTP